MNDEAIKGSKALIQREFTLTQADFEQIRSLVGNYAGIKLSDHKIELVYSRLARHLRRLGYRTFSAFLEDAKADQMLFMTMMNALTTNLTQFFREEHHFDYVRDVLIPELKKNRKQRIRFWSAACSSGEEPYSAAMVWHKHFGTRPDVDFKLLATDIDTNVLKQAKEGIYPSDRLNKIPEIYHQWLKFDEHNERFRIGDEIRRQVYFKQLNLISEWPMKGPFDLILCRNVLIYFDKAIQEQVVTKMIQLLAPGGCLMLGHSENVECARRLLKHQGKTIYRKQ